MTKRSVELPIEICDLHVTVSHDGVWLHFGQYCLVHVAGKLVNGSTIIDKRISDWCAAREEQAKLLPGEMG